LCFRCGERYFVGHKCQNKGLHVLEDEELLCTKELSLEETSHELHDHTLDNTQGLITMCASQLQSKHKTLKFQGQIGQLAVLAMIDSGSTHSFIVIIKSRVTLHLIRHFAKEQSTSKYIITSYARSYNQKNRNIIHAKQRSINRYLYQKIQATFEDNTCKFEMINIYTSNLKLEGECKKINK
jgi:hypothetical protein